MTPLSFSLQNTPLNYRRLYIGGVPFGTSDKEVVDYLISNLQKAGGIMEPGTPVLKNTNNPEKRYIFLELRSAEETSCMIQLDGIKFKDSALRIRRPEDFDKMPALKNQRSIPKLDTLSLGILSTKVQDSATKVFVGGLPKNLNEDQVRNLLMKYGPLKSFYLVKDVTKGIDSNLSKGYCFCEYADDRGVYNAMQFLNGSKLGTGYISVRRNQTSNYIVPVANLTEEEKRIFEARCEELIYQTCQLIQKVADIKDTGANSSEKYT